MNALIIGGNRFFGKHLVEILLERKCGVTVLNRGSLRDSWGDRVERLRADRTQAKALEAAINGRSFDVVFDQACYQPWEAVQACRIFEGKVGRYVFTSTQSVYKGGPYKSGAGLREEDFNPRGYTYVKERGSALDYAEGKRQAEAAFFDSARFPVVAVRFPIVLGPGDYTGRLEFHIRRVREELPIHLPDPKARISFVEARDAARFLAFVASAPFEGPVNLSSPDTIALHDLMAMIGRLVGREPILASSSAEKDAASPFGIESDWWIDSSRARGLGFTAQPMTEWLEPWIRSCAEKPY